MPDEAPQPTRFSNAGANIRFLCCMEDPQNPTTPVPPGPNVLFESGPILVVNKPGGLLTQAPPGIDSLEAQIRRAIAHRENLCGNMYLAVLHRLDRPVSGALLLSRNPRAANQLSKQFENRQVTKVYWAIVEGKPAHDRGRWVDFMRKVPGRAQSEIVPSDHPNAQYAALDYRLLRSTGVLSLLEIRLETGRTHQIRLQAFQRGLPVIGDFQYGANNSSDPKRQT